LSARSPTLHGRSLTREYRSFLSRRAQASRGSHQHRFRKRSCPEQLHDASSMDLNRAWADPDVSSDLLVGPADEQTVENLPLARRHLVDVCSGVLRRAVKNQGANCEK
jgi:hypothetical protein